MRPLFERGNRIVWGKPSDSRANVLASDSCFLFATSICPFNTTSLYQAIMSRKYAVYCIHRVITA
jgi:hypothetical protein